MELELAASEGVVTDVWKEAETKQARPVELAA